MAEVETNTTVETESQVDETKKAKTPSVEELMEQLAQANADKERYKLANDKLSKSEAELKRRERARMTTAEQEEEARREAEAERQHKYEETLAELNQIKATQAYTGIVSDDKNIKTLIDSVADGDHTSIASIIKSECDKAVKIAQAEWLKSRPQVNSGNSYSTMTKEQILAIANREERYKAIAENIALFN